MTSDSAPDDPDQTPLPATMVGLLLDAVSSASGDLVAAEDPSFRYTYFNEAYRREFERLWGQPLEIGTDMLDALASWPQERDKAEQLWGRALAGESFEVEMAFGPTPEDTRVYSLRYQPIRVEGGPILGAVHVLRDITEQHRAEAALLAAENARRESERRFRNLADHISQLAWMADPEGWIFWYNERWYAFTGTTLEQMQGWGWTAVHHPDHIDRVVERLQHSWDTGEPWEDLFPLRGKDGEYRWFLSRALPIRDAEGKILRWFGTNTDVTDQRAAEQRLRELHQRKDEYLAMLGHELRNPLAAIRSASAVLRQRSDQAPETGPETGTESRPVLEVLDRQIEHMTHLIDGLLEMSRVATGKIAVELTALDAGAFVEEIAGDVTPTIEAAGLRLGLELPPRPVWIAADRVRLRQVLDNLLGNAIKFTDAPGTIALSLTTAGTEAVVRVSDSGAGIEPAKLEHVFESFYQEAPDVARERGGLGLGLAVAKALVELHHGSISIDSAGRGCGTEVEVRLPLSARPAETEARAAPPRAAPRRRILIVEDNTDAAQMLAMVLDQMDHEVLVANHAREALDQLRTHEVDLVLCDIGLPELSGIEFARRVRADEALRELDLVALTGYGQAQDRAATEAAGFDAHLTKPVDIETLRELIARFAEP